MTISVEVLCHSLHPSKTSFIATLKLTFPKSQLTHLLTHKAIAKNTASARAIPTKRFRRDVLADPAFPEFWGRAGKGMTADGALDPNRRALVQRLSRSLMYAACGAHWLAEKLGASKETINRWLEPWAYVVVVASGNDSAWSNFITLCEDPAADPTTRALATAVHVALRRSPPILLQVGQWHLPYCPGTLKPKQNLDQSVARCARVSYATLFSNHADSEPHEDADLVHRLSGGPGPVHASPFEHQALAMPLTALGGLHFGAGWQCYRSMLPGGGTSPGLFRDDEGYIKGSEP